MICTPKLRFVRRHREVARHVGMDAIYETVNILQHWWEPDGMDWHNHAGTNGPEPKGEWRDVEVVDDDPLPPKKERE